MVTGLKLHQVVVAVLRFLTNSTTSRLINALPTVDSVSLGERDTVVTVNLHTRPTARRTRIPISTSNPNGKTRLSGTA